MFHNIKPKRQEVLGGLIDKVLNALTSLRTIKKYQGVKEFHMLARIGCCNFMVFSPFKVNVTYYHPVNQWLLGATNGNQGQTVMHHQCSETINHL